MTLALLNLHPTDKLTSISLLIFTAMNNEIFKKTQSDLASIKLTGFNDLSDYFTNSDQFIFSNKSEKKHLFNGYSIDPDEEEKKDWVEYIAIDNSFTVFFNVSTIRTSLSPKTDFKGYKLKLCVGDEGSIPQYEVTLIS